MRRSLAALLVMTTCLLVAPVGTSRAEGGEVPAPKDDGFYRVPDGVRRYANGTVLDARRITAYAGLARVDARAWQVKYRTTDGHGRPTSTLATILVPNEPWEGRGRRPLVSYQVAEDGVGLRCTPSYALRAGLAAGLTTAQADIVFGIPLLLQRGWAVVVPDWEGPRSLFGVHAMAGHAVLDGIRAARRFGPAHLGGRRPIGLWGYSGGGFATTAAAQLHRRYAPGLPIRAIAAGGVPGDIRQVYETASGSVFGGATILLLIAMSRGYPDARLASYADDTLRADMAASREDCLFDAPVRHPLLDIEAHLAPRGVEILLRLLRANSPLAVPEVPRAPMFMYHMTIDELVPLPTARRLAERFCNAGARLRFTVMPGGEHAVGAVLGGLQALDYLAGQFDGERPPTNC